MKRIVVENTKLFSGTSHIYGEIDELKDGQVVELGEVITADGYEWIEVKNGDNVSGYIRSDTKLLNPEKPIYLNQNWVDVFAKPDLNSQKLRQFKKYDEILIAEKAEQGSKIWYKVYDCSGNSGYIESDTILLSPAISKIRYALYQDSVDVYQKPDLNSKKVNTYYAGQELHIIAPFKDANGMVWCEITTSDGSGYINADTKLEDYKEYSERQYKVKNEIYNASPVKLFFHAHGNKVLGVFLILLGLVPSILGLLTGRMFYPGFFTIAVGILIIALDLDVIEGIRLLLFVRH